MGIALSTVVVGFGLLLLKHIGQRPPFQSLYGLRDTKMRKRKGRRKLRILR